MSSAIENTAVPSVISRKLRTVRLRDGSLLAIRGIAVAATIFMLLLLLVLSVDWILTLRSTMARTLLSTGTWAVSFVALIAVGLQPLRKAFETGAAARKVDAEVPQMQERWTTVANCSSSSARRSDYERQMLQQVRSEAVALESLVRPEEIARWSVLKVPTQRFVGALCTLMIFFAVNWQQTSVLLQRFLHPTRYITATQLMTSTGDVVVPRGETIALKIEMTGLQRSEGQLVIKGESFIDETVELQPGTERANAFVCSVDVDETFQYRMTAGDGETEWHTVTAIDYPTLEDVRLTVTSPGYIRQDPVTKTLIPGRLRVFQGSTLKLEMKPDCVLKSFQLVLVKPADEAGEDAEPDEDRLSLQPESDGWYRFEAPLLSDFSLQPEFVSTHDLPNEAGRLCRIHVIEDQAPVARVISPTDEMAVMPDDEIEIKFEAHDDHGIAKAELIIYDDSETEEGEEPKILAVKEIPLDELKKHVMGSYKLDLKEFDLEDGRMISYSIRVTDNRNMELNPERDGSQIATDSSAKNPLATEDQPSREKPMLASNDGKSDSDEQGFQKPKTDSDQSANSIAGKDETKNRETTVAKPEAGDKEPQEGKQETSVAETMNRDQGEKTNLGSKTESSRDPALDPRKENTSTDPAQKSEDADEQMAARRSADGNNVDGTNGGKRVGGGNQGAGQNSKRKTADQKEEKEQGIDHADSRKTLMAKRQPKNKTDNPQKKDRSGNSRNNRFPGLLTGQTNDSQRRRNNRRRLKISERFAAVAESTDIEGLDTAPREIVVKISKQLAEIESDLSLLVNKAVANEERSDRYRDLDSRLDNVEGLVDEVRTLTAETQFSFVGLQMLDICRTHISPARDGVFVSIRKPDLAADTDATEALHHVTTARELIDALLEKHDDYAREKRLAGKLDEAVRIYEIYVENAHRLMRASRQNKDPLKIQRKMAVVEVDQSYLDRFAEVEKMRLEMMAEFRRILSDDPRLLARYMDLIKRQRDSLRSRLREVLEQQTQVFQDVSDWQGVDEEQKPALWAYFAELRLLQAGDFARDVQAVSERLEKQMPLILDAGRGSAAMVIQRSQSAALMARECQRDAKAALRKLAEPDAEIVLSPNARRVISELEQLMASLDQLDYESGDGEGVASYIDSRVPEARTLLNQADSWLEEAGTIERMEYHHLASIVQQEITIATELLRTEMLEIEDGLPTVFQQLEVPEEIVNLAREINGLMEAATFNQISAGFQLSKSQFAQAAARQKRALERLEQVEKLFDQMRRKSADYLDENEVVRNPTADQLRDPTLDEFLRRLEREPNLQRRLGLPNRPRNLRIIRQSMLWNQNGGNLLGKSRNAAMARAQQNQKRQRKQKKAPQSRKLTEQEKEELQAAEKQRAAIQQKMEETMKELQKRAQDKNTSAEERRRLEDTQKKMRQRLDQMKSKDADDRWDQIVQAEQMEEALAAIKSGKQIPDTVWNKLQSTLDDGLWQVGDREPPEDYRKRIQDYLKSIDRLTTSGVGDAE